MKIATIGYLHGSGGAERQIILLSNELAQKGHEVHLVILNENKAPYLFVKALLGSEKSIRLIETGCHYKLQSSRSVFFFVDRQGKQWKNPLFRKRGSV